MATENFGYLIRLLLMHGKRLDKLINKPWKLKVDNSTQYRAQESE